MKISASSTIKTSKLPPLTVLQTPLFTVSMQTIISAQPKTAAAVKKIKTTFPYPTPATLPLPATAVRFTASMAATALSTTPETLPLPVR